MKFAFLLLIAGVSANSQTTQKIYYTDDWKVTTSTTAPYYRIVNRDAQGQISGPVKDYYSNDTLQWEGYFSYIDAYDNNKDLHSGPAIWYHPNGKKSQEANYVNNKWHGTFRTWDEEGYLLSETDYVEGVLHGKSITYHPKSQVKQNVYNYNNNLLDGTQYTYYKDGKLYYKVQYKQGKLMDYYIPFRNAAGFTSYIFNDDFRDKSNPNGYTLANTSLVDSKITDKGLSMRAKTEVPMAAWFNHPKSYGIVNSLKATVEFVTKEPKTGVGFAFFFKDWNNYNYVVIEQSGLAKVGIVTNGVKKEAYKYLTVIKKQNMIEFFYDEQYFLAVNGTRFPLETFDYDIFYKFEEKDFNYTKANLTGLFLHGGPAEVLVTSFSAELVQE